MVKIGVRTGPSYYFIGAVFALFQILVATSAQASNTSKLFFYGSVAGADYTAGNQDPFSYYYIKGAIFDPYSRLGLGIALQENRLGPKADLIGASGLSSGHTWSISKLLPITVFFVPSINKGTSTGPLLGRDPYNMFYLYSTFASAAALPDWSDRAIIAKGTSFESGLGYSFAGILDIKAGYQSIRIPSSTDDYLFPGYKENKAFISLGVSLGFLFASNAMQSGEYLGFVPWIKNPIEDARAARENAKPFISSYSPNKPVIGSSLEISGNNFRPHGNKTAVFFGKIAGEITEISDKTIAVRIPGNIQPGNAEFKVRTSAGDSGDETVFILPAKPPMLAVSEKKFIDDSGDRVLSASEGGKIAFELSNAAGAGKAFGIVSRMSTTGKNINFPDSLDVGDLEPGEAVDVEMWLKGTLDLETRKEAFRIKITEANDFGLDPFGVQIQTRKLEPPNLELAKLEVDDRFEPDRAEKLAVGNGNSMVEPGESVEVSATLLNKGTGLTRSTRIKAVSGSPDITFLSPIEFNSGDIQPGTWQDLKIAFSVKKGYKGPDDLPIKLVLHDLRSRFNKELPLNIKLKRSYPRTELLDIKGKEASQKPVVMPSFGDELLEIPSASAENKNAIAVVIGVQNYKNKDVPSVEYALNDAQLFKDYLQTALGCQEGNIIYLKDPTKADMEKVFGTSDNHAGQLSDYVKKGKSDVFVYYTGHGAPDLQTKKAYFVPSDTDPNYAKLGGYPLDVFYDNLSRLPARHISVVLDACFSGRSDKGMIISKASPLMIAPVMPGSGNINVFSSSKADEVSSWYPEKRHSLFTYFFLKGLQGAADKNDDHALTAAELEEYVTENVPDMARRLYGRKQTPGFTGQKDKVVARY